MPRPTPFRSTSGATGRQGLRQLRTRSSATTWGCRKDRSGSTTRSSSWPSSTMTSWSASAWTRRSLAGDSPGGEVVAGLDASRRHALQHPGVAAAGEVPRGMGPSLQERREVGRMPDGALYFEQANFPFAERDDLAIPKAMDETMWTAVASPRPIVEGPGGPEKLRSGQAGSRVLIPRHHRPFWR